VRARSQATVALGEPRLADPQASPTRVWSFLDVEWQHRAEHLPSTLLHVDLSKHRVGSRSSRVMGNLLQHVLDPCLMSGQVGMARASLFGVLGSGFLG
jgi:hypothetical protein